MLKRLMWKYENLRKSSSSKQKEYFTIVILPGPNSRVHKFSISKTFLRNAGITIVLATIVSFCMFGEYFHMRGKVWELDMLRYETVQQKEQLKQFAGSIIDMKGQMARLKDLSERLSSAANIGGRKGQQILGIGGTPEISPASLDEFGKKSHSEMMREMSQELENLKNDAAEQEAGMNKLMGYFERRNSVLACTPSIWPVKGFITSEFGYRTSPIYGTRQFHQGIDIANDIGTPIMSAADGVVSETGYSSGYGQFVKIQHGYGMATLYAHLSKTKVRDGQSVKKGEMIGCVGITGSSTGPHLHYEVWVNGVPVNPRRYI